jgi:hypothetical protein
MDIRNPVAFVNFMRGNAYQDIHPTMTQLCKCVDEYNRLCGSCSSEEPARVAKYNECAEIYIAAVHAVFPTHTLQVMAKVMGENSIAFYREGKHIRTISR